MDGLRVLIILSWIALPAVMFGGYALVRALLEGDELSPERTVYFRAGHGHAGSLLLMSLLFDYFIAQTSLSSSAKVLSAIAVLLGGGAIGGGFFLHMVRADARKSSPGITLTVAGSVLASLGILVLVYGLITM